jgi:hypothetical protein
MPIHLPKITTEIELIGREEEIEKIEKLLVNYSTKCEGKTLLVQGIEGLGLMPLAEFLIKEARKNHINTCTSIARKLEKTTIYSAYKSIIVEIINICQMLQQKKPFDNNQLNVIERTQNKSGKYHSNDSIRSSKEDVQFFFQDKLSPRSYRFSISSKPRNSINMQDVEASSSLDSVDTDINNIKERKLSFFRTKIKETLHYLGEDPKLVQLFNLMFPNIILGNEDMNDDDTENRIMEFNNLLIRIMTKLTYKTPLIIVIDQLQYLDPISWKLTELLYKSPA